MGLELFCRKQHDQQTINVLMYINKATLVYGRRRVPGGIHPPNPWWLSHIHTLPYLHTYIVSHRGIGVK